MGNPVSHKFNFRDREPAHVCGGRVIHDSDCFRRDVKTGWAGVPCKKCLRLKREGNR